MDKELLRIFYWQVQLQCSYVLRAADEINAALQQPHSADRSIKVFYAIQNLLNAAANISKALWGAKGKAAAQRKPLRDNLGVRDDSPIQDAGMRNNYEHFDERLERWWAESESHSYFDMSIIRVPDAQGIVGVDDSDRFREYNTHTGDLTFWGQRFKLQPIIDDARRIHQVANQEFYKSLRPEPPQQSEV